MCTLLSHRQWQVSTLLAVTGASNVELARALGISPRTINAILKGIYARLGFDQDSQTNARVSLVRWVWQHRQNPEAVLTPAEREALLRLVINGLALEDITVDRPTAERALDAALTKPAAYLGTVRYE